MPFTSATAKVARAQQTPRPCVFDRLAWTRAYMRAIRTRRKRAGLCTACGARFVRKFTKCALCRAIDAQRWQRKAARVHTQEF